MNAGQLIFTNPRLETTWVNSPVLTPSFYRVMYGGKAGFRLRDQSHMTETGWFGRIAIVDGSNGRLYFLIEEYVGAKIIKIMRPEFLNDKTTQGGFIFAREEELGFPSTVFAHGVSMHHNHEEQKAIDVIYQRLLLFIDAVNLTVTR
jgi:hypothetical protein